VAEGGGLLNRYTVISRIVGSNPIPSANQALGTYQPAANRYCCAGSRCVRVGRDLRHRRDRTREPIQVDRDVTWVLDDWRLLPNAQISDDFGNFMDASHNGRVGNTVAVNGRVLDEFKVRAGEQMRLRLINAANARIFELEFRGHRPMIVALDGQPVEPHEPDRGHVILGPAMRVD
jgi:hypothetical protein